MKIFQKINALLYAVIAPIEGGKFMKKTLLLILSLMLTLSLACPVWAGNNDNAAVDDPDTYILENDLPVSEGWIQPEDMQASTWSTSSISYGFKKTSSTTCKCQVVATRPAATSVKSTIAIQIKNGSTYNTITNGTATKRVNGESISHIATFSISSRKVYRAKIAIQYVQEGITRTNYYYPVLDSNGY